MKDYKPQRENKIGTVLPLYLIFAGLVAFYGASMPHTFMPAILQVISFALFAVAIWVIMRYNLTTFVYKIVENDNEEEKEFFLSVERTQGRKVGIMCEISLSNVSKVIKKEKGYKIKKEYKGVKVLNYCTNMFSKNAYYLVGKDRGNAFAVLIEANEEFLCEIKSKII